MTVFLHLLAEKDKAASILNSCSALRASYESPHVFSVKPDAFRKIPGAPFAYWVSDAVRNSFVAHPAFERETRFALGGLKTLSDPRFLRLWWEPQSGQTIWKPIAKGGKFARIYGDISLVVCWKHEGLDISWYGYQRRPREGFGASSRGLEAYFRPGLTWARRTQGGFSIRAMPKGCIFADKGPAAFVSDDDSDELLATLALTNSRAFGHLVSLQMAFGSYEVGVIQRTPVPEISGTERTKLENCARNFWGLRRIIKTVNETSHAFLLPAALRARLGEYAPPAIESELADIQAEIDDIAFDLYGFSDIDRAAALGSSGTADEEASDAAEDADDSEDDDGTEAVDQTDGLLSWAAGVAFGRFDWRLATGERDAPPEPDPFDPLPAKSPGMLPDDAEPFHVHSGILVDDQGHPNDLARLIEEVLASVEAPVPADVRRWLQRNFFLYHLKQYSKSRRKAPIYWPISTSSGSYTLWLYYPSLTDQTLFTAVNDFIEPKLKQVGQDVAALLTKGSARSVTDEKSLEKLQSLEAELTELRETLVEIAPTYRPNHDDGVQISAALLWRLFRHKPWQKVLKDTWTKLDKGDYDWAHLAMAYWPDRVREKCKTDKSLAIAHDLEDLYEEPEVQPGAKRGRKKTGGAA